MATELSSGAISSILEAVPGIATVLRSPVADAIVNLSKSACGLTPFDPKDAHELIKYAVRRGLIRSDEGDRVAAEVDQAVQAREEKIRAKEAAATEKAAAKKAGKPAASAHAGHPRPKAKKTSAKKR